MLNLPPKLLAIFLLVAQSTPIYTSPLSTQIGEIHVAQTNRTESSTDGLYGLTPSAERLPAPGEDSATMLMQSPPSLGVQIVPSEPGVNGYSALANCNWRAETTGILVEQFNPSTGAFQQIAFRFLQLGNYTPDDRSFDEPLHPQWGYPFIRVRAKHYFIDEYGNTAETLWRYANGAMPGRRLPSYVKNRGMSGTDEAEGADPVELSSGTEIYSPPADIVAFNSLGPSASFRRLWRSDNAYNDVSSKGLGQGWKHNYDLKISKVNGDVTLFGEGSDLLFLNGLAPNPDSPNRMGTPRGVPFAVYGYNFDSYSFPGSAEIKHVDGTVWKFELSPGEGATLRPVKISDVNGNFITLSWNNGRLVNVANSVGVVLLNLTYENGYLAKVTDWNGRAVTYLHGTTGPDASVVMTAVSQISAASNPNPSAKANYAYTLFGTEFALEPLMTGISVPSPTGTGVSTTTITYDPLTMYVSQYQDGNGNKATFTYNAGTTTMEYKNSGNAVALIRKQVSDIYGKVFRIIDGDNNPTNIFYGDTNNPYLPTSITDADNKTTSFSYNLFGRLTSSTTPRGVTTNYSYDYSLFPWGLLTKVQTGTLPAVSYSYFPNGALKSITSPKPGASSGTVTTTLTKDSFGNITSISAPGNNAGTVNTTTFHYTTDGTYTQPMVVGQPIRIVDSTGKDVHLRYDSNGRLISKRDALGNTHQFQHNIAGQVTAELLPATGQTGSGNGRIVKNYMFPGSFEVSSQLFNESNSLIRQENYTRDQVGQVLSIGGLSDPATYTYDAAGRVTASSDGNGNSHQFFYNAAGRMQSKSLPGGASIQYTSYSPAGRLLSLTDASGTVKNFEYNDPDGQLTAIKFPGTTSLNSTYTYDGYGRILTVNDGQGSYSNTYGQAGEIATTTTTYTGLPARTMSYSYYPDGSRSVLATPFGNFTYNYDLAGRLTSLTNPNSEISSWNYYANGWLQRQVSGNGFKAESSYNALGLLTSLQNKTSGNTIRSSFSGFGYDGAGNQTTVSAANPGLTTYSGTVTNAFNLKNELTSQVSAISGGYSHSFGSDQGGNLTTIRGATRSYNTKNQLTGTGFSYDLDGNATTYAGVTNTFDAENRLLTRGTYSAGYGSDGLRAWRQNGSVKTYFLYDGSMPVFEMTSTGAWSATNTFGANGLLSRRTGTATTYYAFDPQGNTVQRINAAQAVISNHRVDAYGSVTSNVATTSDPWRGRGSKFGYYWENTPGLYVTGARYYDPVHARFLTQDPAGLAGGPNLYRYTSGNPISGVDPSGMTAADVANAMRSNWAFGKEAAIDSLSRHGTVGVFAATTVATLGDFGVGLVSGTLGMGTDLGRFAGGCGNGISAALDAGSILASAVGAGAVAKSVTAARATGIVASGEKVVIGETMARVKAAAKDFGASYYEGNPYHDYLPSLDWIHNKMWLNRQVKRGHEILDIGLDISRPTRSPVYAKEDLFLIRKGLSKQGVNRTRVSYPSASELKSREFRGLIH